MRLLPTVPSLLINKPKPFRTWLCSLHSICLHDYMFTCMYVDIKHRCMHPTCVHTKLRNDYEHYQREVKISRGLMRCGYWKFSKRRLWSTLLRNSPPLQLEYTSDDSWTALSKGRWYNTPFAASTSTSLSKHIQQAQAEDGRGPESSYTGSLNTTLRAGGRGQNVEIEWGGGHAVHIGLYPQGGGLGVMTWSELWVQTSQLI